MNIDIAQTKVGAIWGSEIKPASMDIENSSVIPKIMGLKPRMAYGRRIICLLTIRQLGHWAMRMAVRNSTVHCKAMLDIQKQPL